jgi:dipeptidyl aminopeptidase/acylaminoacyl peptidase
MNRSSARPAPVTAEELFAPPEYARPTISPDGRRLAFLAPWGTRLNVWVLRIGECAEVDLSGARRVTADSHRAVLDYCWSDDPRYLLYLQDTDGDENRHLFRVDLDEPDSEAVDLTPYPGARVWRLHRVAGFAGSAVVDLNHRAAAQVDLCEIEVATGELTVLAEGNGDGVGWIATGAREVFDLAVSEAGWELRQRLPDGGLRAVTTFPGDDQPLGPAPWAATPDGRGLWFGSYRGGDRLRLAFLDLATGEETEVDSHPTHDLDTQSQVAPLKPSTLITDRGTGELIGVRYSRERQVIRPLTDRFARVLAALEALSDGDLGTVSSDEVGRYWVASFNHDRDPSSWLYDHVTGAARLLFRPLGRVDPGRLAPMVPVSVTARDGLEIPSYLTLPVGHDPDEHTPPPMVLMPHGGPWTRDAWGLDIFVQYFATRGYAVLQPNFRGSTGFGRAHMQAAIGEFAGAMHDDLIDAVEWAATPRVRRPRPSGHLRGLLRGLRRAARRHHHPDPVRRGRRLRRNLRPGELHADRSRGRPARAATQLPPVRRRPRRPRAGDRHARPVTDQPPRPGDHPVDDLPGRERRARGAGRVRPRRGATAGPGCRGHLPRVRRRRPAFLNPENLTTMLLESGRFLAVHLGGRP